MSSVPPPEDAWLPFIRDIYPDRYSKTYFLPPLHFNKVPYSVESFEGEDVVVYEHLPPGRGRRGRKQAPAAAPDPQVAGTVFTRHPAGLQPRRLLDSDLQDDQAQERVLQCLRALGDSTQQAMVVISQLEFRHYLDDLADPINAAAAAQLPTIPRKQPGECDIVIIHKTHGLILGEIKSVGGKAYFANMSQSDQDQLIVSKVEKAVSQANSQEVTLRHLVSDLGVKVTKTVILPNITTSELMRALSTDVTVAMALCQCVDAPDLSVAVSRCLCKDNMPVSSTEDLHFLASVAHLTKWARLRAAVRRLAWLRTRLGASSPPLTLLESWWSQAMLNRGPDPRMTDDVYDRLLARFCGPATTVDVPTVGRPRKVVRTQGQAVAETGLTMSSLALYPHQVDILSSPRGSLYLWGPPGTGKSVMLFLKGKQWLNQQREVHVVSTSCFSRAVNLLMYEQLRATLGAAATASTLHFHHWNLNFDDNSVDVSDAVKQLLASLSNRQHLFLIMDEVKSGFRREFTAMCEQLHNDLQGSVTVWAAGVTKDVNLPPWLSVETLTLPLRCPPAVHKEVKVSTFIDDLMVPRYSSAAIPAPTDGLAVQWVMHDGPDHFVPVRDCRHCAQGVVNKLSELVGVQGQSGLQWRDVLIVYVDPSPSEPVVKALLASGIPVTVVDKSASEASLRDLAMATTDQVTVVDASLVAGLERRIVVGLEREAFHGEDRISTMSRSTGVVIWVGNPRDA